MVKYTKLPAISGKKLIRLLQKDNWEVKRRAEHGVALAKAIYDRTRVTVIPDTMLQPGGSSLARQQYYQLTCPLHIRSPVYYRHPRSTDSNETDSGALAVADLAFAPYH